MTLYGHVVRLDDHGGELVDTRWVDGRLVRRRWWFNAGPADLAALRADPRRTMQFEAGAGALARSVRPVERRR